MSGPSPYMLMVVPVKKPKEIPAVTHVDGTGRVKNYLIFTHHQEEQKILQERILT